MTKEIQLTYKYDEQARMHQSSTIQADILFNFMSKVDFLKTVLNNKCLSPRYVKEDLKYLNINNIRSISFPMKCFCDIQVHQLELHMEWYGDYGISFLKEWGMKKGIQPIHYINENSDLCKDFSEVLNLVCKEYILSQSINDDFLKSSLINYVLHNLMYYKPYKGYMSKWEKDEKTKQEKLIYKMKCFQDECEWRFVPNVEIEGFKQIYIENDQGYIGDLKEESNQMANMKRISLNFEYDEIANIVCRNEERKKEVIDMINELDIDNIDKELLISKTKTLEELKSYAR